MPPRPFLPVPDGEDPVAVFARDLRALKDRAGLGAPTIDDIAAAERLPRSTLYAALGGKRVPTQRTLEALVRHWNGDLVEWSLRRAGMPPYRPKR